VHWDRSILALPHLKPAPFDYVAPRSLDEAIEALGAADGESKLLAGGQSLIPLLNFRLARPDLLIDLNRVPDLAYIRERDGGLAIGAMTRDAAVERAPAVAEGAPLLSEAIRWVGHAAIRARGTIGGNLAHADPAAELPAVAVCLGAEMTILSPRGHRSISAEDFFVGYLTTALEANEILTEVWVPVIHEQTGQAWVEFARRHGDFALVGVAVSLTLEHELVSDARIVLTGVGGTPFRAREAETLLVGGAVADRLSAAADAVRSAIDPDADIHASKEYRTHLAGVLTERAIQVANERALAAAPQALDLGRTLEGMGRNA
jgi:aerobic carbon-monoxide dehydrogenase medium subunit